MLATRLLSSAVILSLLALPLVAQSGAGTRNAAPNQDSQPNSVSPQPKVQREIAPLPGDPLELATGPTATVDTPQKRLAMTRLLQQARRNIMLHAADTHPFTLKVTFTSTGHPHYSGAGDMEEAWASGQSWRWNATLADYHQDRVFFDGFAYDEKSPGPIPLRLHMVRGALFNPGPMLAPQALMRIASAQWQGTDLMCVLISGAGNDPTPTPGRRWTETEHCIDPKTGLLHVSSEAPGIYVVYDYASAVQFHGKTLPREISVVEGGNQVLDIHLESIEDGAGDPARLKPTPQMMTKGPGTILTRMMRFPQTIVLPNQATSGTQITPQAMHTISQGATNVKVDPVIVLAIIDEHGKVIDAEALQNTDPTMSEAALRLVKDSTYRRQAPGTVPQQREAFINVRFVEFTTGGSTN